MKVQGMEIARDDLVKSIKVLTNAWRICVGAPETKDKQEVISAWATAIAICTAFLCDNFGEEEHHED